MPPSHQFRKESGKINSISQALGECAFLYQEATLVNKLNLKYKGRNRLKKLLFAISLAHEALHDDWEADETYNGFLKKEVGGFVLRVPWNLIPLFPDGDTLNEVCKLATEIRQGRESTICISGSFTMSKFLPYIDDLDFCEYVPISDETLFGQIAKTAVRPSEWWCCYKIQFVDTHWSRPWERNEIDQRTMRMIVSGAEKGKRIGKCDFIVHTEINGVLTASNLILIVDDCAGQEAEKFKSFPAQEAPYDHSSWVPRRLDEPLELGKYICWLRCQLLEHEKDNPAKALKRLLSLTRVLFRDDLSQRIIDFINSNNYLEDVTIESRYRLLEFVEKHNDADVNQFATVLRPWILKTIKKQDDKMDSVEKFIQMRKMGSNKYEDEARKIIMEIFDDLSAYLPKRSAERA